MKKHLFTLIIFFIYLQNIGATGLDLDSLYFGGETHATFSGGENTPFWLVSNMHGLGSPKFNNGYVRGYMGKSMSETSKFSWGARADLVAGWNLPGAFRIQQLFAELKYRKIWILFGAKEINSDYNNPRLSSGNLLFSGNALPIPQLRMGTQGFAPFWGTKGWFSVNLYLAYGMFTDSNWQKSWVTPDGNRTKNVLFCSRGFWIRGGNWEKFPLTLDVGIQMATEFGGTAYRNGEIIKPPTRFIDWIKAIIPLSGSHETLDGEQTNIQGNMNGEYNISLSFSPASKWHIRAYWEHYFEDQSQMTFEYGTWKDGLWGLEISFPKNKFISNFVYEYNYTKDQTGPINHDWTPEIPEQVSGGDNYFNHALYNAWQSWGMTIGTPLAISPLYNRNHQLYIYDTRFIANHFGLEGQPLEEIKWRLLMTFSQNWGTYRYPFPDVYNNFSGLIEVKYTPKRFKGWWAHAAIAWDKGRMLGNNFGGMISIGYVGSIQL